MRIFYRMIAILYDPLGYITPGMDGMTLYFLETSWRLGWNENGSYNTWNQISLMLCEYWIMLKFSYFLTLQNVPTMFGIQRTEDPLKRVEVAFLTAWSQIALIKQLSMQRLELCAALTGAQLAHLLKKEIAIKIYRIHLWSDSTSVQTELHKFKNWLTPKIGVMWIYLIIQQMMLQEVRCYMSLWKTVGGSKVPPFLNLCPEYWPRNPSVSVNEDTEELHKPIICINLTTVSGYSIPEPSQVSSFNDLVHATVKF